MGRPLVWVAIAFGTGILIADRRPTDPRIILLGAGTVYALWLLAAAVVPEATRRSSWYGVAATIPLVLIFGALGYLLAILDPMRQEVEAAAAWDGRRLTTEGRIMAPVERRDGRQRVVLRILRANGTPPPRAFTVMATLPSEPRLRYGDVIATRGVIVLPPEGGNPGEPSVRAALRRLGISALYRVPPYRPAAVLRRGEGNRMTAGALLVRERLVAPLLTLPEPHGGVLAGLLYGAQVGVGQEMEEIFRRAGLLHVLVVSGAQVGLLAASAVAVLNLLRARPGLRLAVAGAIVLLFGMMVGWGAAVGRAAVMALVGLGAMWLRRDTDRATSLALAALLWLAIYPGALFGLGFQLSFAATWGLLFLSPTLTPPLRPRWLSQVIGTTLGAQLAVLPLLAVVFQRLSIAAFPANLLVLPIVAVLVPAGFILSLLGLLLPQAAGVVAPAFLPPVWAIIATARVFARAPGAEIWLPPVSWGQAAGAYMLLGMVPAGKRWIAARRVDVRWISVVAWVLIIVAIFTAGGTLPDHLGRPQLLVVVLDVGQGDAILVRGPTGRAMLVDGGGEVEIPGRVARGSFDADERGAPSSDRTDIGLRRVVPALRRLGVRRLSVVLLSHAHEDHVGGLPAVLQNFSVDLVVDPGVPHPSPSYVRFLDLVRQRRITYALARRGQHIDLGGGASAAVVWPPEEEEAGTDPQAAVNARSVVARVEFGRISFLLTGDIEAETETLLVRAGPLLESTVLKIAHHGSKTSTTPLFLDAVRPTVAVISVGRGNLFGHPHVRTLHALQQRSIRLYRTDRDGAVVLRTDGRGLNVETMRPAILGTAR